MILDHLCKEAIGLTSPAQIQPLQCLKKFGPLARTALAVMVCLLSSGCAAFREQAHSPDFQPCNDAVVRTRDGWLLGIRHYRPKHPDPSKLPVVLCHGLGLNATFWTITDNHLPAQLTAAGYDVFVYDARGSGNSTPERLAKVNNFLRNTPFPERGERTWTTDDQAYNDIPAVLEYVRKRTGQEQVNWIGHSLGGMLMFTFLEEHPERHRIANFVGMGSTAVVFPTKDSKEMARANAGICLLSKVASTSRIARPMRFGRPPGLAYIDRFYYTRDNVETLTVDRFYGYTLEDPGTGALKQLQPYLGKGQFLSADGKTDYSANLDQIKTPTLFIAGQGDVMADVQSKKWTFDHLSSTDKTFMVFGKSTGYQLNYGHCDLVWAKSAPTEIFPEIIHWLDPRQRTIATPQALPQEMVTDNGRNPYVRLGAPQTSDLPIQLVVGHEQTKLR